VGGGAVINRCGVLLSLRRDLIRLCGRFSLCRGLYNSFSPVWSKLFSPFARDRMRGSIKRGPRPQRNTHTVPQFSKQLMWRIIRRSADKSLAFPIFLYAAQPKYFFLGGLKKLEQRSHECVWSLGGICRVNTFFFSIP
jgi:hypothetical protein